jgi:hypothetical protein
MSDLLVDLCVKRLSDDLLRILITYIPNPPRKWIPRLSPTAERDLRRIQKSMLKGKNDFYMRDLEDFLLD